MFLILVGVLVIVIVLAAINSSLKTTTKSVDGLTGELNRFNRWLDSRIASQREGQARRQAAFDEKIAAKRAERRKP